jgi:dolichyl-phosphate beta-glucosyltransferase
MLKPKLSVIIPAYNEEKRLPRTLDDVVAYLRQRQYSWEIIVVDDGSTDGTRELVAAASTRIAELRLIAYDQNRGKGYAVRQGMLAAAGKYRLFMDADNSTTIDHVERFWPYFAEGADVVIGSRDVPGAEIPVPQPWYREVAGSVGNLIIQLLAVPGINDTQAGFKAFTDKAVQDVFPRLTINRWGFDVEILAVARLRGFVIKEVPIRWVNDPESKVKLSSYFAVLREVLQVRLNIWRGVYETQP